MKDNEYIYKENENINNAQQWYNSIKVIHPPRLHHLPTYPSITLIGTLESDYSQIL